MDESMNNFGNRRITTEKEKVETMKENNIEKRSQRGNKTREGGKIKKSKENREYEKKNFKRKLHRKEKS